MYVYYAMHINLVYIVGRYALGILGQTFAKFHEAIYNFFCLFLIWSTN